MDILLFKNTKNNNYFEVINFITLSKNNINKYPNKEIFLWTIHNKREEKLVLDKFSNTNYYLIKDSYSSFLLLCNLLNLDILYLFYYPYWNIFRYIYLF